MMLPLEVPAPPDLLLVEDNPLNQKLVTCFLTGKGYAVAVAGSTQEAERWLEGRVAALILLDVSLPGEDGLTFVRRLRLRPGFATPVLALTAHAMPGDRDLALGAGCDAYLSKPLDLAVLLQTVRDLVSQGRGA
jgi:CheY-like chemotaxis protein